MKAISLSLTAEEVEVLHVALRLQIQMRRNHYSEMHYEYYRNSSGNPATPENFESAENYLQISKDLRDKIADAL